MSSINRRDFVKMTVLAGCACCMAGGDALAADKSGGPVDVGTRADYAADGIFDPFARSHNLFVVRQEGRLFAVTSRCSHKGSRLKSQDGGFFCPSHKSTFTGEGKVTKGPAEQSLYHLGISEKEGRIFVDVNKTFPDGKWNEEGAFLKLD